MNELFIRRHPDGRWQAGDLDVQIIDIEVFPNYWCVTAFDGLNYDTFDMSNINDLVHLCTREKVAIIGYNNFNYDNPMLRYLIDNHSKLSDHSVYGHSRLLVAERTTLSEAAKQYRNKLLYCQSPWTLSIDLFEVLNRKGSLKEHACRMGMPVISDCPFPFDQPISREQIPEVHAYNKTDVIVTSALFESNITLIHMRHLLAQDYGLGDVVFCMSEAKVAEHYALTLYQREIGYDRWTVRRLAEQSKNNSATVVPIASLGLPTVNLTDSEIDRAHRALLAGRLMRSVANESFNLITDLPNNSVTVGQLKLTFGCGGLHSEDGPALLQDDSTHELWDVDVASFYPSLMINYGIRPSHLLPTFTSNLAAIRDRRLEAKRRKEKIVSDSMKLIINSTFGKMGDHYSALRDDIACMRVTLSGQILLLSLIDVIMSSGAEVLSANTDGLLILVPIDTSDSTRESLRDWERQGGLALETVKYQMVARRDVNNYIAFSAPDADGNIATKSKGTFSADTTKTSGRIIPLAVQQHLQSGQSIDEIISTHPHAADFLFYARAKSDGHYVCGSDRLPKTIRWYASLDGQPIMRVGKSGKRTTVPQAHRATLALCLQEGYTRENFPGLDIQAYIESAQKLLTSLRLGGDIDAGTAQARALQEQGLLLLPQSEGRNPKGVALDDIAAIQALSGSRCEQWAIVTGPISETLSLDIDHPELLNTNIGMILAKHPTLTTWHGDGSADAVRSGRMRGAIHFRYDGSDIRIGTRASKAWLMKHGFEVAFGKKVQTVVGRHRTDEDQYQQHGAVIDAPPKLIEYLALHLGPPRKSKVDPTEHASKEVDLDLLRQAADAVLGSGWGSVYSTKDGQCGIHGMTPGHRTKMRLWVRNGRVGGHSFHTSYDTAGTVALVQAEWDHLRPPGGSNKGRGPGAEAEDGTGQSGTRGKDPDADPLEEDPTYVDASDIPPPPSIDDQRIATDCAEAFDQIQGIGVVIGATGTGKSWQAAQHALERHNQGLRTLLIVQDKEAIDSIRRYVVKHAKDGGQDPESLRMQLLISTRSENNAEEDDDDREDSDDSQSKVKGSIKESTLILITHHHFCSRKPLTTSFYPVLHWVAEHSPEVFLDEADLYIERQNPGHQLDGRYLKIGREHAHWMQANHCPSVKAGFRCKQCHKRSLGSIEDKLTHHRYQIPHSLKPSQFEGKSAEEFMLTDANLPSRERIDLPSMNLQLASLAQTPGFLAQRCFERKKQNQRHVQQTPKEQMLTYLRDLIDCSFRPTLAEPFLVDNKGQLVHADPHDLSLTMDAEGHPVIDGMKTASWHFPYFTCRTRFLLLYDCAPLTFLMRSASRLILMSATIGDQHIPFLNTCAEGASLVQVTIPIPKRRDLKQVIIIGHQGRIDWRSALPEKIAKSIACDYTDKGLTNRTTIERIGNALTAAGKPPLVFMPTKEDASLIFDAMKERGWAYYIKGEFRTHSEKATAETTCLKGTMALLSYARSSIGTGANLPEHDVVIVDGTVRRPHYLFNPTLKTEESYLIEQENDRVRIMTQNVGRILRGSGVKFVFVTGISPGQLTRLAAEVERLAETKTVSWFTGEDTITAMAALVQSVKAGQLVVPEATPPEEKPRRQQSRKQRARADAKTGDVQGAPVDVDAHARRMEVVRDCASRGMSWRETSRKINAQRLSLAERHVLQAAHRDAGGAGGSTAEENAAEGEADAHNGEENEQD